MLRQEDINNLFIMTSLQFEICPENIQTLFLRTLFLFLIINALIYKTSIQNFQIFCTNFIISALYLFHEFTFIILGLKLSPSMGMGTNSASQPIYTPRGAIHVQASQIEQEIDELKTVLKVTRIGFYN